MTVGGSTRTSCLSRRLLENSTFPGMSGRQGSVEGCRATDMRTKFVAGARRAAFSEFAAEKEKTPSFSHDFMIIPIWGRSQVQVKTTTFLLDA